MASNSLSPNVEQGDGLPSSKPKRVREPDLQRMQRAVMSLAMFRARQAVKANIRGQGLRLSDFYARQITELAEGFFAQHMEELINEAVQVIATDPSFARYRCAELNTNAQTEKPCAVTTILVQNLRAKWRANQ